MTFNHSTFLESSLCSCFTCSESNRYLRILILTIGIRAGGCVIYTHLFYLKSFRVSVNIGSSSIVLIFLLAALSDLDITLQTILVYTSDSLQVSKNISSCSTMIFTSTLLISQAVLDQQQGSRFSFLMNMNYGRFILKIMFSV